MSHRFNRSLFTILALVIVATTLFACGGTPAQPTARTHGCSAAQTHGRTCRRRAYGGPCRTDGQVGGRRRVADEG